MKLISYVKESFEELNDNMTWLPWNEAQKSTVVVALFTIVFALAIFAVDKVFQNGLDVIFTNLN